MGREPPAIRAEQPHDAAAVRAVNRAAFGGDVEADLVARLHADGDVLLSLVAVDGDHVVGHILFSRLSIETARHVIQAAALAPLAVLPAVQRQGIGGALVRDGLVRCRERGVAAVVVLCDPVWYARFGFRAETARGLQTPWPGPHLMALELLPGGLGDGQGVVARYPAAFASLAE